MAGMSGEPVAFTTSRALEIVEAGVKRRCGNSAFVQSVEGMPSVLCLNWAADAVETTPDFVRQVTDGVIRSVNMYVDGMANVYHRLDYIVDINQCCYRATMCAAYPTNSFSGRVCKYCREDIIWFRYRGRSFPLNLNRTIHRCESSARQAFDEDMSRQMGVSTLSSLNRSAIDWDAISRREEAQSVERRQREERRAQEQAAIAQQQAIRRAQEEEVRRQLATATVTQSNVPNRIMTPDEMSRDMWSRFVDSMIANGVNRELLSDSYRELTVTGRTTFGLSNPFAGNNMKPKSEPSAPKPKIALPSGKRHILLTDEEE